MILLVDNYDCFTYNLAHLFQRAGRGGGRPPQRRDRRRRGRRLAPSHLVVSPGPGPPVDSGATSRSSAGCADDPDARRLPRPPGDRPGVRRRNGQGARLVHGKASIVTHDGRGIFAGLPNDFARRPLPLARRDAGARLLRDLRDDRRRRGDGRPPPRPAGRRRPVPSRVGAHARSVVTSLPQLPGVRGDPADARPAARRRGPEPRRRPRGDGHDHVRRGDARQIGGFLVALRMKGETADEIAGSAEAMRAHVIAVRPRREDLVDTAGTGRRRADDVSTSRRPRRSSPPLPERRWRSTATGPCPRPRAPRTCSSRSGSGSTSRPSASRESIDELGFGFMFAPTHHPGDEACGAGAARARRPDRLQRARPADEPGRCPRPGHRRLRSPSSSR